MAYTIEFYDKELKERIRDLYKRIDESQPLGMSFVDFLSLGVNMKDSNHVYFKLEDNSDNRINMESYYFARMKEFTDLCIKDPSLYNMETFMFFLHMEGLDVPENCQGFHFDENNPVEDLIKNQVGMTSFEVAIRGFAKSDKTKNKITSIYTCNSIEDICMASLYHLIKLGLAIKKCGNCDKYFVPLHRSDEIYCDRISPFNHSKTCKEDGSQRTFEEKLKTNEVEKLRRGIYQAKQMLVRRNPDIEIYKQNFENWKSDVDKWKEEIKKGHKTSEEFKQWLNDSKKKK